MTLIEKFMGIAFTLIALALIVKNATKFNTVVNSISGGVEGVISQLQDNAA